MRMRRSLWSVLLALWLVSTVKAQVANGQRAEKSAEAEKELVKYENGLIKAVLAGGSVAADFFDRDDAGTRICLITEKFRLKPRMLPNGDRQAGRWFPSNIPIILCMFTATEPQQW